MAITHVYASRSCAQCFVYLRQDRRPLHLHFPGEISYILFSKKDNYLINFLQEYKAKVMFSRNAFLVDIVNTSIGTVLKLDSIEASKLWNGVDVLIFDSWHWWLHTGRKQPCVC